jgi:hypothetical protein
MRSLAHPWCGVGGACRSRRSPFARAEVTRRSVRRASARRARTRRSDARMGRRTGAIRSAASRQPAPTDNERAVRKPRENARVLGGRTRLYTRSFATMRAPIARPVERPASPRCATSSRLSRAYRLCDAARRTERAVRTFATTSTFRRRRKRRRRAVGCTWDVDRPSTLRRTDRNPLRTGGPHVLPKRRRASDGKARSPTVGEKRK